jgi:hypothetical protein
LTFTAICRPGKLAQLAAMPTFIEDRHAELVSASIVQREQCRLFEAGC